MRFRIDRQGVKLRIDRVYRQVAGFIRRHKMISIEFVPTLLIYENRSNYHVSEEK
jgi:hypothetical protein